MTLRDLRVKSGKTEDEVAVLVSAITGRTYTSRAVVAWEFRGVQKHTVVMALSDVYKCSIEDIQSAAAASRVSVGTLFQRGRPRKIIIAEV
jgi:hypothetical protein